jgi:L-ascorbate metabolism protein UlaG (beta-lactamase superfamily)
VKVATFEKHQLSRARQDKLYLKQNVVIEPLFNQWYAWSYLISPATAAMCIANLHLKIMQSFVAAPQIHVNALKNLGMIGGPFINYPASRVDDIKALIEKTQTEQAHMLELAEAIKTFDQILLEEATGYSIEPLYEKVPECLKGYIELVYDLNNQPSIRFIEGLLYKSPYYNLASQSVALSLTDNDDRSFIFSTPRLEDDDVLHLKIPFHHPGLDELFKMKYVPQTFDYIKECLEITEQDEPLFSTLFTTEANNHRSPKYEGNEVRIRYFGHACLLIETDEVSILTDPLLCYEHDNGISRYTYADLPETIDYLLITHNHQDHLLFEHLLQLRHKVKHIIVPKNNGGGLADPSLKFVLKSAGFDHVSEIDEMEEINLPHGTLMGLPFPGEHVDLNIRTKIAYYINLKGRSILCLADSTNHEPRLYQHLHESLGDVDVLFLGMECDGGPATWLYGPLLTKPLPRKMDQSRRFESSDYEKAISVVKQFNPHQVYVYAMGQEPWIRYITSITYSEESRRTIESNQLVEECRKLGMESERLFCQKDILLSPS